MKRIVRGVTALLTAAILTIGVRAQTPAGAPHHEPVNTRLPVSVYYSLGPDEAKIFEGFLHEYQESHPYLDLQGKNFSNPDLLYKSLTSGQVPTLALMETSWLSHLSGPGQLMPVEKWMDREQFLFNWSVKCNCYLPLWDAAQVNGTIMALPYYFTTRALIYNTDLFAKAKIKAPPVTWEQLSAIAQKLTDPATAQIGFALSASSSPRETARSLQTLAWQAGGDMLSPQGMTGSGDRALALLGEMTKAQAVEDPDRPVPPQSVGMFIGTVHDYLDLKARGVPVKTCLLPGPDKTIKTTEMQAWTLGMFKTFPDNQLYKVQELAFWLLDFPQQLRWAEQTPYLAAHVKVFENPFYRQLRLADHPQLRVFLNSLNKSKPVDTAGAAAAQLETIGKKLPPVMRGEKAARDLVGGPVGVQP